MPVTAPAILALAAALSLHSAVALAQEALPPVDPAISSMTPDQKVAARQKAMKADNRVLRDARNANGDAAVAAATEVLQNFVNFPALFDDPATNTTMSKASSDVWKDLDTFNGLFVQGRQQVAAMLAAAKSGDTAGYGAQLRALGQTCFECHQSYRID